MSCDITQIIYPGYDIQTSGWMKTRSGNHGISGQFPPYFNIVHIEVLPFGGGFQWRRENTNLGQLHLSVNSGLYYPNDNSYIEYNPAVNGLSTTSGCILSIPFSGMYNMSPTYANVRFRAFMPESSYLTINNDSNNFSRCSLSFSAVDGDIFNVFTSGNQTITANGGYTDYNIEFPLTGNNYGREINGGGGPGYIASCNLAFYGNSGNGFRISEIDLIMSGVQASNTSYLYRNIDEGTLSYSDSDYIYTSGASYISPSSAVQHIAFSGGTGNFSPTEITTYPQSLKLRMRAQRGRDKDGGDSPASVAWYVTDNKGHRLDRAEHTWDMYYPLNSSVGTYGDYEFTKRAVMPSGADLTGTQFHLFFSGYPIHQNVSGIVVSAMELLISGCHLENFCAAPISDSSGNFEVHNNWSGNGIWEPGISYNGHPTSGLFRNIDDFYIKDMLSVLASGGSYTPTDSDYITFGTNNSNSYFGDLGSSKVIPNSGNVYLAIKPLAAHDMSLSATLRDSNTLQILSNNLAEAIGGPIGYTKYLTIPLSGDGISQPAEGFNLDNLMLQLTFFSGVRGNLGDIYPNSYELYAVECCISGSVFSSEIVSTGIPLYISGHMGTGINNSLPLYVSGSPAQGYASGFLDLYINGGFANNLDLFVQGIVSLNSGLPLYTEGHWPSACLPLYLQGQPVSSGNNSLPFFTFGSNPGTSGFYETTTFYTKGVGTEGAIPLYLAGASTVNNTAMIPLYAYGAGFNVASGVDLFIQNNYIDSGIPLYMRGRGISVNPDPTASGEGLLLDAAIPLFINRVNEVEILPLYLHNSQLTSGFPMYVMGAYSVNSGIDLVIPNIEASSIKHLPLYTHGF